MKLIIHFTDGEHNEVRIPEQAYSWRWRPQDGALVVRMHGRDRWEFPARGIRSVEVLMDEPAPQVAVAEGLFEATEQRPSIPDRPESGPYPATISEVADEVVRWIDEQSVLIRDLPRLVAERLSEGRS